MRRWLAHSTATEEVRECDDEPREPVCVECGGDAEGGHAVWCSYDADYYEPPGREFEDDEVRSDGD